MQKLQLQDEEEIIKVGTKSIYDFSDLVQFHRTKFGLPTTHGNGEVQVYATTMNVSTLKKNFSIFEELNNVEDWPISKLIQRELDHERTQKICNDYLLNKGNIRYFPPLTAVIIPTNNKSLPQEAYQAADQEELKAIKARLPDFGISNAHIEQVVAGFAEILAKPGAQTGLLQWDNRTVYAVIIDGQHRYEALKLASAADKHFDECLLTVNLIDLTTISKQRQESPTSIARNLFIAINNTPTEVDEARIVLMDDRDATSAFTQVLIDDSDPATPPAISPELIDWRCDGGKHDNSLALSGVITLRGVISSSLFKNYSVASIDDRSSLTKVKNWVKYMKIWIDPDDAIAKQLDVSETIDSRYNQAVSDYTGDDDGGESPFLFSYSAPTAKIIRNIFKERFLDVFKMVFTDLLPYQQFQAIAKKHHAFDKGQKLHIYLRAFRSKRKELDADKAIFSLVNNYSKDLKKLTEHHLLFTVMGQKAVFKTLFENYLNVDDSEDRKNKKSIENSTEAFIESFNIIIQKMQPSKNISDDFYNIHYRPAFKKFPSDVEVFRDFWRGILLGINGELDYSNTAVDLLSSIIFDMLAFDPASGEKFKFTRFDKIKDRHAKMIRKAKGIDQSEADDLAQKIVQTKQSTIGAKLSA